MRCRRRDVFAVAAHDDPVDVLVVAVALAKDDLDAHPFAVEDRDGFVESIVEHCHPLVDRRGLSFDDFGAEE